MGAKAFYIIDQINFKPGECIVEIGSGESTKYLSHQDVKLFSVDIDGGEGVVKMTGEKFLREEFPNYNLKIKFAYLDNFDWPYKEILDKKWFLEQKKKYLDYGVELTEGNSQSAHLEQSKLLLPFMAAKSVIVFDDTWVDNGYQGKGGTAVLYLLNNGFEVIIDSYYPQGFVVVRKK